MKYLSITLFIILISLQANAQQNWTNYSNDRIFNDIEIDGNDIWIGSQGGLTRTNIETGEFETYLASNSPIKGGGISEVERAPDGSMWFGSENAGVFHFKDGEWIQYFDEIIKEHYYRVSHLQILPNGDVWFFVNQGSQKNSLYRIRDGVVTNFNNIPDHQKSFCVTDENTVFIGYNNYVYKYDVQQKAVVETWHSDNSIIEPEDSFTDIVADKEGGVLLASPSRILRLASGNANGDLTVLDEIGLYVYSTFEDEEGVNFLQPFSNDPEGTRLIKYDGNELTYYKDEDFGEYPIDRIPFFLGADKEGSMYAAFYTLDSDYLIYRFADNEWTPVESQIYPIASNYQVDVQSDCHGNLWFGGLHGIDVKYVDGTWEHFEVELEGNRYFSSDNMTVDPITCDVWIANRSNSPGPENPGIIKISNGEITGFLYDHANIEDIEASIDGKVYFYSVRSGFGYIENDEVVLIDEFDKYEGMYAMDVDSKGNIYLGSRDLGLIKYDGEYFDYLGTGDGSNRVYRVYVDNDDFIWIRTTNGLMQFDGINWHTYEDFEFGKDVTGMAQDEKGNFWISTWFNGLLYWNKETFQTYDINNSDLSSNDLRNLAFDPLGNLIVTQNIGASVLTIPNNRRNFKGTGTVFYDEDKDGMFEEGIDVLVPGQKVRAEELNAWAFTNPEGKYSFYSEDPQTYSFRHAVDVNSEPTTDNPQTASIINNNSDLPDFGFWRILQEEVAIDVSNGLPICNREFKVHITIRNKDIAQVFGDLRLRFNSFQTILESSIPISQQTDDEIVFEDITLDYLKGKSISITFEAPGISEDFTSIFFEAIFETSQNQFSAHTTDQILCSYDPNDKKVEATGEFKDDFSLTQDAIKYTIRFQNEGTYKAFDIAVIDTLDSVLDPSTFELLASSHRVETTISDAGIVTFSFPNIDLPTKDDDELGSQGFVSFTIKPYPDTENFTVIYNSAGIYFDFNPPIITNTTVWNVVDDLSLLSVHEVGNNVLVYPNPSDGQMQIKLEEESLFRIMDISGKLMKKGAFSIGLNVLELDVKPGVYLLHLNKDYGGVSTMKLVVY